MEAGDLDNEIQGYGIWSDLQFAAPVLRVEHAGYKTKNPPSRVSTKTGSADVYH
jgi:hypothetical protein